MDKKERLARNLINVYQLAELIKIYYFNSIKDTKFRNPAIQGKAEKIKEFANSIQAKELKGVVGIKGGLKDRIENEHCVQLWRLFEYFSFRDTSSIEEFMNAVELEQNKVDHENENTELHTQ